MREESQTPSERLYLEFLETEDPDAAERSLESLMTSVIGPQAASFLRHRLRVSLRDNDDGQANQDALDLLGEIRLAMISALRRWRASKGLNAIRSIEAYTTVVCRNFYHEYLRRKHPVRFRLRNQLHYLLDKGEDTTVSIDAGGRTVCGMEKYAGCEPIKLMLNGSSPVLRRRLEQVPIEPGPAGLGALARAVLTEVRAPVALDELVTAVVELQGLEEPRAVELTDVFAVRDNIGGVTDLEQFLTAIWKEITSLSLQHRRALLLHLADDTGDNLLILFSIFGVASIRMIAAALEIDARELAGIWNRLPLQDKEIAELMGIERQQVINLRQSARRSMAKRMENMR